MQVEKTTPVNLKAGKPVFRPGEACPGFLKLSRGTIRVSLTSDAGREVVLYRVRPGGLCLQTFSCLINGRNYAAEGVAETDIEGEILPAAVFFRLLDSDDAFRMSVLAAVAERFEEFEQRVEDVALTGLDARLARVLLALAAPGLPISSTHEALAAETASGRAVVSRKLAEFERSGLLVRTRGKIDLLDRKRLEQIAAGNV